ncbi:MAG: hypothetical protein CMJ83_20085 [Planctomycetes bacterium]|nr:hypothetical protein [Planctomycetota bacterium]
MSRGWARVLLLLGTVMLWACGAGKGTAQVPFTTREDAAGGCDGKKNGGFGFHTDEDDRPWWQVDLGRAVAIDRVLIFNRCGRIAPRAAGVCVLTSLDGERWRNRYRHDGGIFHGFSDGRPLVVKLAGAQARHVRLQLPGKSWLHLDEVEVYGTDAPDTNLALHRPADQSSLSSWSTRSDQSLGSTVKQMIASGLRLVEDLRAAGVDVADTAQMLASAEARVDAVGPEGQDDLVREVTAAVRGLALQNPLLDFDRLLLVKRPVSAPHLGLPTNWQGNCSLPRKGYADAIVTLPLANLGAGLETSYAPDPAGFVGDLDLHFDGRRLLFSARGPRGRWQVFEIGVDGKGLRQVTRGDEPDVDSYDACYLPNGDIVFGSTAGFLGVPCVFGSDSVATLYRMDAQGENVRQLCFEQDHDWCPTLLHDGRVLYTRWEYADTPHTHTRLLFHMNPDGTGQRELYGSNSYWPNGIFYARPVPGHASKVIGVVTGHHGLRRMGELVLFDPVLGRREATGVVQRIPGFGRPVRPRIKDRLVDGVWPRFLHPVPLDEKYFLVACQPAPGALWGIYLADVFDNLVLLREEPGYALLEPIPIRRAPRPPVVPDQVDLARKDAVVQIADVYHGAGLEGVPRGSVKKLRVFSYHFAYQRMGGLLGVLGLDGPWDVKRVLGTVPVERDGSASFRVPANTPLSVQPLDSEGKAMQLMRSWMTAMPGETLSCVGCHEAPDTVPPIRSPLAFARSPSKIDPWYGPARGFSFIREVQPVIDRYCLSCHDGQPDASGHAAPDLSGTDWIDDYRSGYPSTRGGRFTRSYVNLHRYVRRPGIESDYHMLAPMEYHADTTELVQMLQKGHAGVRLDEESWDRLCTWIDLNAPFHGTWTEAVGDPGRQRTRRRELLKRYAGVDRDPEADAGSAAAVLGEAGPVEKPAAAGPFATTLPGWPLEMGQARRLQAAAGPKKELTVRLSDEWTLELALIPAGRFLMGDAGEQPVRSVAIDSPFWMATCEVTNEQFAAFDPAHDSRVESKHAYQFGVHGHPLNAPRQPVVRVSWRKAVAFCEWLNSKTGRRFSLPTEAQWEYACRAGTGSAFSFGGLEDDFGPFANFADKSIAGMASDPYTLLTPLKKVTPYDDWIPRSTRFDDGALVATGVGSYLANPWGLHDMHGNVAEWTATALHPRRRIVRGGSWRDRPTRGRSAFRLGYAPWQGVFNVGFRVVCAVEGEDR